MLVPPGDPDALAAAIARLLADPAERRRLEERARAAAAGPYSWDRIAEQTPVVYEQVLRVRVVFMAKSKRSAARALDWLVVEGVEVRGGRGGASPTSSRATSSAWTWSRERHGLALVSDDGAVRGAAGRTWTW